MCDCIFKGHPCLDCRKTIENALDCKNPYSQMVIYSNIQDLKGTGEEWLVDSQGNVRCVFIDGNLKCQVLYLNGNEKTKVA